MFTLPKKPTAASANKMKILFVCSANVCRSPMAEGIMRQLYSEAEIDSGEYRADDRITEILRIDDVSKAEISFAEADCLARNNVLTRTQCEALGYEPSPLCTDDGAFCLVRQSRPLSMNIFALPY